MDFILPEWSVPENIRAISTTRRGGVSTAPFQSLNLGAHVGDDARHVASNRAWLVKQGMLPAMPLWLEQVHGTKVLCLNGHQPVSLQADAVYTQQPNTVCAVMTADCLPVLFCSKDGKEVAAAHAGWRGLCNGVLEATIAAFNAPANEIFAWFGPAIGPTAFEVGPDVRDAFLAHNSTDNGAFRPAGEKYYANIWHLARSRLLRSGVHHISGGSLCTYSQQDEFFSFRRDGVTGRMASLIWLI